MQRMAEPPRCGTCVLSTDVAAFTRATDERRAVIVSPVDAAVSVSLQ